MLLTLPAAGLGCTLDRGFELRRLSADKWVYAYAAGAASRGAQDATWSAPTCKGSSQSPIDVQSRATIASPELNGALEPHLKAHVPLLFNTGHYFELDKTTPELIVHLEGEPAAHTAPGDKGWSLILNGTYTFYQVHWHAPSENRIDGKQYAMEAHYVHQLSDPVLVGTNEKLAVIALLYELSEECNADLEEFWTRLPMGAGDAPFDKPVDIGSWIEPLLPGGYYCARWNRLTRAGSARALAHAHPHMCVRMRRLVGLADHTAVLRGRGVEPAQADVARLPAAAGSTPHVPRRAAGGRRCQQPCGAAVE